MGVIEKIFPFRLRVAIEEESDPAPQPETELQPQELSKAADPAEPAPSEIWLSGDLISLDAPQRRIIGVATSERVDRQGHIVPLEASIEAFRKFADQIGIREMHQPKAIGKLEKWWADEERRAVLVQIYLSKSQDGEDALTKVREGVLKGLSIRGRVNDWDYDPQQAAKIIKSYDLVEISLVDVPANPDCRIVLVKMDEPEEVQMAMSDEEKEKVLERLRAIGRRVGIARKEGEPLTAPKGYPEDPDPSKYGDPANFSWPVDNPGRARSAIAYYNAGKGRDVYSAQEWATLGRRIARLASKQLGKRYRYDPKKKKIVPVETEKADLFDILIWRTAMGEFEKRDLTSLVQALRAHLEDAAQAIQAGDADRARDLLDQALAAVEVASDAAERTEAAAEKTTSPTGTGVSAPSTPSTPSAPSTPSKSSMRKDWTEEELAAMIREVIQKEMQKFFTGRELPKKDIVEAVPPAPPVPSAVTLLAQGKFEKALEEAGGMPQLAELSDRAVKEMLMALGVSSQGVAVIPNLKTR